VGSPLRIKRGVAESEIYAMLSVRRYGCSGPPIIVLHGGPGASGHMAPVAHGLAMATLQTEFVRRQAEIFADQMKDVSENIDSVSIERLLMSVACLSTLSTAFLLIDR
jgi:hypothetical protein